jgi:hypothetical protein
MSDNPCPTILEKLGVFMLILGIAILGKAKCGIAILGIAILGKAKCGK